MTNKYQLIFNVIMWTVISSFLIGISIACFRIARGIYEYIGKKIYGMRVNVVAASVEKISVVESECIMIDNCVGDSVGIPVAYEV